MSTGMSNRHLSLNVPKTELLIILPLPHRSPHPSYDGNSILPDAQIETRAPSLTHFFPSYRQVRCVNKSYWLYLQNVYFLLSWSRPPSFLDLILVSYLVLQHLALLSGSHLIREKAKVLTMTSRALPDPTHFLSPSVAAFTPHWCCLCQALSCCRAFALALLSA